MAKWIVSHFPKNRKVYVEPFGGAMSVLLNKPKLKGEIEIYNDLDRMMVDFFRVIRDPQLAKELSDQVTNTPFSRVEFEDAYKSSPTDSPVEKARKLLIRSYMGFNSIAIFHRKVGFNSRRTSEFNSWLEQPENILEVSNRIKQVVLECMDASDLMQKHDAPTTLFYVDPPYILKEGTRLTYTHEMRDKTPHINLAQTLNSLEGMVVLSGYDWTFYSDLYPDWLKLTKASYASSSAGAIERMECIWLNPPVVETLRREGKELEL